MADPPLLSGFDTPNARSASGQGGRTAGFKFYEIPDNLKPRVVTVASLGADCGKVDLDDLQSRKKYSAMKVYNQSKLADLLFALELQRRSDAHGWGITSIAVHPGLARTDLMTKGMGAPNPIAVAIGVASRWIGHSAERGALVTIYAATSLDALGGRYYGPNGLLEFKGSPDVAKTPARAEDPEAAARLWDLTVRLVDDTRHEASPDDAADSGITGGRDRTSVA